MIASSSGESSVSSSDAMKISNTRISARPNLLASLRLPASLSA